MYGIVMLIFASGNATLEAAQIYARDIASYTTHSYHEFAIKHCARFNSDDEWS